MTKIDLPKSSKELITRFLPDCEQPENVNEITRRWNAFIPKGGEE